MQVLELHHFSVIISNLKKSLAFYTNVLNLEVDSSRPDLGYLGAWLKVGVGQIHLLKLENPDTVSGRPEHVGHDRHIALTISNFDELLLILESHEIKFTKSRSGRKAVFFRDPDGNGIECIEE